MVRSSLMANTEVATVLGLIPASSDTVESEGRQMKQCWIKYMEKNPLLNSKKGFHTSHPTKNERFRDIFDF